MRKLRQKCDDLKQSIGDRLFELVSHGEMPTDLSLLLTQDEVTALKHLLLVQKGHASIMLPPICTHNVWFWDWAVLPMAWLRWLMRMTRFLLVGGIFLF